MFNHLDSKIIKSQVEQDYKWALNQGYNIFTISPFGSINYNLDTEDSDVDVKIIVIPTLDDLITMNHLNKTFRNNASNREVGIIDIRDYFSYLKINSAFYWEFLTNKYLTINKDFSDYYLELYDLQEDILYSNPLGGINSISGQFFTYYGDFFKRQIENEALYNPKKIIGMKRTYIQLLKYVEWIKNKENMNRILWRTDEEREELLKFKHQDFTLLEAKKYVEELKKKINNAYIALYKEYSEVDKQKLPVNKKLDELLKKIIKKNI